MKPLAALIEAANDNDQKKVDQLWSKYFEGNLPVIDNSSVTFLFKGSAKSVSWNGDFNAWSRDTSFINQGKQIGQSDIWLLQTTFPVDARLDYKIVVDNKWSTDPNNPNTILSGTGTSNSEIRMPDWEQSKWVKKNITQAGTLDTFIIESINLSREIEIIVYRPFGYENLNELPTIYITDGHEYINPQLGSMVEILDNLIEAEKIEPLIAIFIDPRNTNDRSKNLRADELTINSDFLEFVNTELLPVIDSSYNSSTNRARRAILGTSLGGLNASYFGANAGENFGNLMIQSPAYWYRKEIFELVENSKSKPIKVSMTTGLMHDTQADALKMKSLYESKEIPIQYIEVNEGHSWGNWQNLIDDQLIFLFPKPSKD